MSEESPVEGGTVDDREFSAGSAEILDCQTMLVTAEFARDLERRLCALAIHTIAMCKWCETMADKLGWDRDNAGAIWASHDAARAAALAADRQEPAPDAGAG